MALCQVGCLMKFVFFRKALSTSNHRLCETNQPNLTTPMFSPMFSGKNLTKNPFFGFSFRSRFVSSIPLWNECFGCRVLSNQFFLISLPNQITTTHGFFHPSHTEMKVLTAVFSPLFSMFFDFIAEPNQDNSCVF